MEYLLLGVFWGSSVRGLGGDHRKGASKLGLSIGPQRSDLDDVLLFFSRSLARQPNSQGGEKHFLSRSSHLQLAKEAILEGRSFGDP